MSEGVPPENLDPLDDQPGTSDHHVERLEGLLPAEPLDPLYQELQVGLNGTEIHSFGITAVASGSGDRLACGLKHLLKRSRCRCCVYPHKSMSILFISTTILPLDKTRPTTD